MRIKISEIFLTGVVAFFAVAVATSISDLGRTYAGEASRIEQGKKLAFDRKKGNCLACHIIADGEVPGNTAPPLVAMKARFKDISLIINQIGNPLDANPDTIMPPFGLHNILSEDEINMVAEFLYTL